MMKWIKYIVERFTKGEKGYMHSTFDHRVISNPSIAYKKVIRTIMSIEDTNKGHQEVTHKLIEQYHRLYSSPEMNTSVIERVRIDENAKTLYGILRLRMAQLYNED